MTDAYYTDDLELLTSTPAQIESLLQSLEQAAGGVTYPYMNMWNVHRMFITYIHRIPKHEKHITTT